MNARLTGLFTYPVKSCAGLTHTECALDPFGLAWDRRWMIVDAAGHFVTQRTLPALARVRVALDATQLQLHAPGLDPLRLPLASLLRVRRDAVVWRDRCEAWDEGELAAAWLTRATGEPLRLMQFADDFLRPVDPRYSRYPARTAFADAYPCLLVSAASVRALNDRLQERGQEPVPTDRFRGNLLVDGVPPDVEDTWRTVRIGEVVFDLVKPCERCVMTTVDQASGSIPVPGEPLATLATYRRFDGKVIFGQNAVPRGLGTLRVGDPVEVLATHD